VAVGGGGTGAADTHIVVVLLCLLGGVAFASAAVGQTYGGSGSFPPSILAVGAAGPV
jgi:hypothetical protein